MVIDKLIAQIQLAIHSTQHAISIHCLKSEEEYLIRQLTEIHPSLYQWDAVHQFQSINKTYKNGHQLTRTPIEHEASHPVIGYFSLIENWLNTADLDPILLITLDLIEVIQQSGSVAFKRQLHQLIWNIKRSPHTIIFLQDTPHDYPLYPLTFPLPKAPEIESLIHTKLQGLEASARNANAVFRYESSFIPDLARTLQGLGRETIDDGLSQMAIELRSLTSENTLPYALNFKKSRLATLGIQFLPPSPHLLQGLPAIIEWAQIHQSLLHSETRPSYLSKPDNLLILGIPGTGKSLAVKQIAHLWNVPCIVLDMGNLFNKHLGESEKALQRTLDLAETIAPCILFLDEVDKQLGGIGQGETDGGTTLRMLGKFLTWLQESVADVIVIATANRPWGFKPEFLRRFTKFLVLPPNETERYSLWQRMLAEFHIHLSETAILQLSAQTPGYSGAEIERCCRTTATLLHQEIWESASVEMILKLITATPPLTQTLTHEIAELTEWAANGGAHFAHASVLNLGVRG